MTPKYDLQGLIKFLDQGEWRAAFEAVFDSHFEQVIQANKVEYSDIARVLGDRWNSAAWGCVFEDFLTKDFTVKGGNIIDVYLKRLRRFGRTDPAEGYMKALRTAIMSLYEVGDVVPDQSLTLKDLVRGGDPVLVIEKNATKSLKEGDRIACRVVQVKGAPELSGGLLPFSPGASTLVLDLLKQVTGNKEAPELPALKDEVLQDLAPVFTMAWLVDTLSDTLSTKRPMAQG